MSLIKKVNYDGENYNIANAKIDSLENLSFQGTSTKVYVPKNTPAKLTDYVDNYVDIDDCVITGPSNYKGICDNVKDSSSAIKADKSTWTGYVNNNILHYKYIDSLTELTPSIIKEADANNILIFIGNAGALYMKGHFYGTSEEYTLSQESQSIGILSDNEIDMLI